MIRFAVLVRHHADHFVALHLGLERAADAAVGAGGDDAVLALALRETDFFDQRRGGAGLHARAAGDAFGIEETACRRRRPWNRIRGPRMVSAKVPCTSSQARTQREQTMHLEGSKVKYGFELSLGGT